MRFVMVPVPSEHVREVISMVLMMSSDGRQNAVRDQGRLRTLVEDSNPLARRLLGLVAEATLDGQRLSVPDAARRLDEEEGTVLALQGDLAMRALDPGVTPIEVRDEPTDDAPDGPAIPHLIMRRQHAAVVRATLAALDPVPADGPP